eukprot:m.10300 g.10300  ORF g.10300 m.10300 type:complete len:368 (+) comp22163_c0_seq1:66-1169(+)
MMCQARKPDFDLTNPYCSPPIYNSLRDRHLKHHYSKPEIRQRLVRRGLLGSETDNNESSSKELNQIKQRFQNAKLFVKEREREEERCQKRMRQLLRKEAMERERIKVVLKSRKEILKTAREKEIEKRAVARAIYQREELKNRSTRLEKLKEREAKRGVEIKEKRTKVHANRIEKVKEKQERIMGSKQQRKEDEEKRKRAEEERHSALSKQRHQLFSLLHDKQKRLSEKRREMNKTLTEEKYKKSEMLLITLSQKKSIDLDASYGDMSRTFNNFQLTPIAKKQMLSASNYANRYREACGLPAATSLWTVPEKRPYNRKNQQRNDKEIQDGDKMALSDDMDDDGLARLAKDIVLKAVIAGALHYIKSWL